MYKFALWDIDGTVIDFLASENQAIKALFRKYNLGECTDEMIERYSQINVKYWEMLERGEMTKPEILVGRFREFFTELGIDPEVAVNFNNDYQPALGDYIEFMPHAMEELEREKGKWVLIAVTNGTKDAQTKKLSKTGLDKLFDYIFISEDVGVEKPNREYFDYVFDKAGIKDPKEAIIIGDSLTSDMRGGAITGIDTCWYNPYGKENKSGLKLTYEVADLADIKNILRK